MLSKIQAKCVSSLTPNLLKLWEMMKIHFSSQTHNLFDMPQYVCVMPFPIHTRKMATKSFSRHVFVSVFFHVDLI